MEAIENWKLKLRHGRLETAFRHFTVVADGEVVAPNQEFGTLKGPAFFAMKVWAPDPDQAIEMTCAIGQHVGFAVTDRVYVYDTEPGEPPQAEPHGYDLKFTPYEDD